MPEGPEVAIIREGLSKLLENATITGFNINKKSRYHKKHPDGYVEFASALPLKVIEVGSKGKFIYIQFENGHYLLHTLGLSGGWYHTEKTFSGIELTYNHDNDHDGNIHDKICDKIRDNAQKSLWFNDQRHFATFKFSTNRDDVIKKLTEIGPDMLQGIAPEHGTFASDRKINPIMTPELFIERLKKIGTKSNKNITVLLMEQKVVSGVGNYLKSESLYSARINPWARINNLTDDNLLALYGAIRDNIGKSYRAGGASIRHYSDINDVSGIFEYDMNVYNKKKCSDGTEIKHEETPDKRATYWCPSIQIIGVS